MAPAGADRGAATSAIAVSPAARPKVLGLLLLRILSSWRWGIPEENESIHHPASLSTARISGERKACGGRTVGSIATFKSAVNKP
ncbi:hypothetical protein GCM10023334_117730 [Nonomuraea thailandensis]